MIGDLGCRATKFAKPADFPIHHQAGDDCKTRVQTVGQLLQHVNGKHAGAPAMAVIKMLVDAGLVTRCDRCRAFQTTRGLRTHKARCDVQAVVPAAAHAPPGGAQSSNRSAEWQWDLLDREVMLELCAPGVRCAGHMHPHVVGKVADVCHRIRARRGGEPVPGWRSATAKHGTQRLHPTCHTQHTTLPERARLQLHLVVFFD